MTATENPKVLLETSLGNLTIELYPERAPKSVANFLQYVKDKHYVGTIFHRVINGFMIQAGGFNEDMKQKPTREPIENEARNGLKNVFGAVAMARTSSPHSATSQFFINLAENTFLDYKGEQPNNIGYCVFGQVIDGEETIAKIRHVKTGRTGFHDDVPREAVTITSATLVGEDKISNTERGLAPSIIHLDEAPVQVAREEVEQAYTAPADTAEYRYLPKMVGSVPAYVQASIWNKNGDHPLDYAEDTQGLENGEMRTFTGAERKEKDWEGSIVRYYRTPDIDGERKCPHCGKRMHDHGFIDFPVTHSYRVVCPGDFIVATTSGYHAMKPAVFEALFSRA